MIGRRTMNNRVKIDLPVEKLNEAIEIAKKRDAKKEKFGSKSYNNTYRSSEDVHIVGAVGEAAVAHFFGVDMDKTIFQEHGDAGVDNSVEGCGNIEVKTTTYWKDPYLRVPAYRPNKEIDYYVLCYVDKKDYSNVWIVGAAKRDEVVKKTKRRLYRDGPLNYILEEKELEDINDSMLSKKQQS